jgi:hypothetical protein
MGQGRNCFVDRDEECENSWHGHHDGLLRLIVGGDRARGAGVQAGEGKMAVEELPGARLLVQQTANTCKVNLVKSDSGGYGKSCSITLKTSTEPLIPEYSTVSLQPILE